MSELKLTVLIENTAPQGLIAEHGLSIHLDYKGKSFLLDAGESGVFLVNAERLGIDLTGVEAAALSHGHYDHADGFAAFCALNRTAPIHGRTHITDEEYHESRYIGVAPLLMERRKKRFVLSDEARELSPGLWVVPDQVVHEQSLVVETAQGLVVLNSCCHAGADKVIQSVQAQFPDKPIRALIGGFHLMGDGGVKTLGVVPGAVLALGAMLLSAQKVEEIWTGHCTGIPSMELLQTAYADRIHPLTTGLVLEF